jgi:hypothetical protein
MYVAYPGSSLPPRDANDDVKLDEKQKHYYMGIERGYRIRDLAFQREKRGGRDNGKGGGHKHELKTLRKEVYLDGDVARLFERLPDGREARHSFY